MSGVQATTRHATDWSALADELRAARVLARADRRSFGHVLPATKSRLHLAIARATTALAIDDARTGRAG